MDTWTEEKVRAALGENLLDFIRENFNPDDIFSEEELSLWADNNDYEKTEEE